MIIIFRSPVPAFSFTEMASAPTADALLPCVAAFLKEHVSRCTIIVPSVSCAHVFVLIDDAAQGYAKAFSALVKQAGAAAVSGGTASSPAPPPPHPPPPPPVAASAAVIIAIVRDLACVRAAHGFAAGSAVGWPAVAVSCSG